MPDSLHLTKALVSNIIDAWRIWGVIAIGLTALYFSKNKRQSNPLLSRLPLLKFNENDSVGRYIAETGSLLQTGYQKFSKKGQAYLIRNPIDDETPQVILPLKYLDEVKSAPQNRLSFPLFSDQSFLLSYSGGPQQTDATAHIVRMDLTRDLGNLVPKIYEECVSAYSDRMSIGREWTPIRPYELFAFIIARITARIMVGPELCHNQEWLRLSIETTMATAAAAQTIRAKYPPRWRWLAAWFHPGAKAIYANRKAALRLIEPIVRKRQAAAKAGFQKPMDGIQWLLDAKGAKKSPQDIADQQLFLSIASIHTTAASITAIFYDLINQPRYHVDLIQEIKSTLAEENAWNEQNIRKLRKLDSFMKESQRINPIGYATIQRSAVNPYTFKDGLQIPANTQISMPSHALNLDPDIYTDPSTFDGLRFFKMREAIDPNKFHFASVSNTSINFGAGSHACPGRFFASHEIKLMLVEALLRFEMKFPDGMGRPVDMVHDFSKIPNPGAEVLFRRRK